MLFVAVHLLFLQHVPSPLPSPSSATTLSPPPRPVPPSPRTRFCAHRLANSMSCGRASFHRLFEDDYDEIVWVEIEDEIGSGLGLKGSISCSG